VSFDALAIAATGMEAQQANLETIANNLANQNTTGFKKARVSFAQLIALESAAVAKASLEDARAGALAPAPGVGAGVGISTISRLFDAGDMKKTDSPLDVAIRGDAFIELVSPDGTPAFTRGGTLEVNADGLLATASGYPLKGSIAIPDGAQSVAIASDGRVQVRIPGEANAIDAGRIELVRFTGEGLLTVLGDNLYQASPASGDPIPVRPGDAGAATLAQGWLESSNVKMVEEMVNLMLAQRAYESSLKVAQAADEVLGMINNLRK
jgi:flagellar basal-body rod protein FlgG